MDFDSFPAGQVVDKKELIKRVFQRIQNLLPMIKRAVQEFVTEVKEEKFPTKAHSF